MMTASDLINLLQALVDNKSDLNIDEVYVEVRNSSGDFEYLEPSECALNTYRYYASQGMVHRTVISLG